MPCKMKGLKTITRDLQVSPDQLVKWQLLRRTDAGYCFLVPVLHLWIREHKPFAVAREEIDQLDPRAHRYYEVAKEEYYANDLDAATTNLEKGVRLESRPFAGPHFAG